MSMPAEMLTPTTTLKQLLRGIADVPDLTISGISTDSRQLKKGDVFFACQGATAHGLDFVSQAIAAKCAAIVWDADTGDANIGTDIDIPMIAVAGLASKIGVIANRWFDSPSQSVIVAGVTGTNGKTTVAYLIMQCLATRGTRCGYIGTIGSGISQLTVTDGLTTPTCIDLHAQLADFRDDGATHAAVEVSSHAIEQQRIAGVHFDAAIFTNLSRDHIDYHGDMHAYGATKSRLFLDGELNHRVINTDDKFGEQLAARCGSNVVAVSTHAKPSARYPAYVFAKVIATNEGGSTIVADTSWGRSEFELRLPGEFNVANAAQVLALLLCWQIPLTKACELLSKAVAPPGRMQRVLPTSRGRLPAVYVDYSHTPASLEAALRALRVHCSGQLWCVFGCGGDRDQGKRALMGEVAARYADRSIVTNDNPRSESPARIIADIVKGMNDDSSSFQVIEDRTSAILRAVDSANADDIVLIAGKGHEDYQIIGTVRHAFSDNDSASAVLRARLAKRVEQS